MADNPWDHGRKVPLSPPARQNLPPLAGSDDQVPLLQPETGKSVEEALWKISGVQSTTGRDSLQGESPDGNLDQTEA